MKGRRGEKAGEDQWKVGGSVRCEVVEGESKKGMKGVRSSGGPELGREVGVGGEGREGCMDPRGFKSLAPAVQSKCPLPPSAVWAHQHHGDSDRPPGTH